MRMGKFTVVAAGLLAGVLSLCVSGVAAPPAAKEAPPAKPRYVTVRVFKATAEAEGFLDLARKKQVTDEDATVVDRLLAEKEGELQELEGQLLAGFGVRADTEYEYDAELKTVFSKRKDADGGVLREPMREIKTPEREQEFLKLIAAKRLTANAIASLKLLVLEKEQEKKLIDQQLEKAFSITPLKNYYYDAAKLTLFEVVDGN